MKATAALLLSFTLLPGMTLIADNAAPTPREHYQSVADGFYEKEKYRQAKSKYIELARLGDRYAQYRLSTMYLDGKAGKKDLLKAFAWAEVAAQDDIPMLTKYRDLVWNELDHSQRSSANSKGQQYLKRYSDNAIAANLHTQIRKELRNCTGSRLGASCMSVKTGSLPVGVGMSPGNGSDPNVGRSVAAATAGQQAGAFGRGGVEGSNIERINNLKDMLTNIETFLDDQSGTVELGDFEVIEDDIDREQAEKKAAEATDTDG